MPSGEHDFRQTLYTVDEKGERKWVYPIYVVGRFTKLRRIVVSSLMIVLFSLPWLSVGGQQAVLLDIPHRKFTFFGETFWATDTIYLMMLFGIAALSLFCFTALFGRVWCGWACPQTVFLEFLFRPLEALIEGSGPRRRRLDEGPWSLEKVLRKGLKYLVFTVCAWFLASTLIAYFVGRTPLLRMMSDLPWQNPGPFAATALVTALLLFQFGWFREQFCTVLCPYARFQSVLLDSNSIVIGYDTARGEVRGKASDSGDCVDCGLCVRVCPTGIDIRNGLQLECIQCASCIDACNSVMKKLERPANLIRYDTENSLLGRPSKFLRPRVLVYAAIIGAYITAFCGSLAFRSDSEFQIMRATGVMPYRLTENGKVANPFNIHFTNKGTTEQRYSVEASDPSVELILPGSPFPVRAGTEREIPLFIVIPRSALIAAQYLVSVRARSESAVVGEQQVPVLGPEE